MLRVHTVFFILMVCSTINLSIGMSREQLKNTMSIMKNQCININGVTNDQVNEIEQGVFLDEPKVMCYISCIYKNIQVTRNSRLDKDLLLRQVDMLYPLDIQEAVKKSIVKCISVQDLYEDSCEGIFYVTRCLFSDDPSSFIFP